MKRWLRAGLLIVLIAGLLLIARRELGIRQGVRDTDEARQAAGIPDLSAVPSLPPGSEDRTHDSSGGAAPVPDGGTPEPSGVSETAEAARPLSPEEIAAALTSVDLEALRAVNKDVAGWIMIPGTELSYPLLQGEDNAYYLNRTWKGAYSGAGSIFLECQNDPSLEGFHTLIYGHRMRDGSMFGSLRRYSDPNYWQAHPSIYIVSDAGVSRYDIFAAHEAEVRDIVYYLDLTGREEDLIASCVERSVLDTGIVPDAEDRIITLSTCTGQGYAARWTVQAALRQED